MPFQVPQFIEHDPKILGPFTVKQTMYVGSALFGMVILYFTYSKTNPPLFIGGSAVLFTIAFALAFIKIEGLMIPEVIKNFFVYNSTNKIYLWKRKESPVFLSAKKAENIEIKEEKNYSLKLKPAGKVEGLSKKINFEK
jgi:hypothetical protein